MPDLASVVSVAAALGVGSLIGQWYGAGKDRRAARANVLKDLAAVEEARWSLSDQGGAGSLLVSAARQLETSALIARVPRVAVITYIQFAQAANHTLRNEAEYAGDADEVGLDYPTSDMVAMAAETVSKAAWASPWTRWIWLRRRLNTQEAGVERLEDANFKTNLRYARRNIR